MYEIKRAIYYIIFVALAGIAGVFLFITTSESPSQDQYELQEVISPVLNHSSVAVPKTELASKPPLNAIPFTPQAPFGEWDDQRQSLGCEEAVALMAVRWIRGEPLALAQARAEIVAISDFEQATYDEFRDTSARDTVVRIYNDYLNYTNAALVYDIDTDDIKKEIDKGNVVAVPVDGTKLENPHYNNLGPSQHHLLVWGYDGATDEFVVHDPGTRFGEGYRYPRTVLARALRDYPTGYQEPIPDPRTAMIVIGR